MKSKDMVMLHKIAKQNFKSFYLKKIASIMLAEEIKKYISKH